MYTVWIKYQLNENGTIPSFVLDGGYFPEGDFLFGVADAETVKDCIVLSDAEMEAHIRSLDHKKEAKEPDGELISLTPEEIDGIIVEFIKIKQGDLA
jgi:hypothetical protein